MPDGRIIAAVQSTLDIDGKSKKQARFTRLVSFDPATGKTAMYGYPIDVAAYSKNSDAKVGDIVALDNQHILLIEQGSDKDGKLRNLIYKVDLRKASDLTAFDKPERTRSLMTSKRWRSAVLCLPTKRWWLICVSSAGSKKKRKGWR
jgi:hypothetical protein